MRSPDLRRSQLRLRVIQVLGLLAFLALAARAAHLSLLEPRAGQRAAAQTRTELALAAERGLIVDRHGAELALTLDAPSVYVVPAAVQDPGATAAALAPVLELPTRSLRERIAEPRPFAFLARWVEPARAERVRAVGRPGIGVLHEPRRVYPHRTLAGSVLGFANIDGEGVRGVERLEDAWLRGRPRSVPVERDAHGRLLMGPGLDPREAAGGDVALTLDATFQAEAEAALADAVAATGARGGFVVSLDPARGDVLALAERPAFDPNRFRNMPYAQTGSRVFLDALEPGSSLKPFVVAGALEAGVIAPRDVFDLEGGRMRVPGKAIRDEHPHPALDVASILRVSSNVGVVKIAQRLGPQRHFEALRRFGFGHETGSGFPEESPGLLRPWRDWKPLDHATIAFGQGVNVTPIQLAAATATLANGGLRVRPRVVAARRRPGGSWEPVPVKPGRRVISARTAAQVLAMLEGVVGPDGTGGRAALAGVRVAGKTGTAQKLDRETGTYAPNRYLAWFAGVAPSDAPRIVMVVGLDEPKGTSHTGGSVAAPLFARVAAGHLTRLGLPTKPHAQAIRTAGPAPAAAPPRAVAAAPRPPEAAPERVAPARAAPAQAPRPPSVRAPHPARPAARPAPPAVSAGGPVPRVLAEQGGRILLPDFRGMTVTEVRRLTAGSRLVVEIQGRGEAVAQEPEPGAILAGSRPRVRVHFAPAGSES